MTAKKKGKKMDDKNSEGLDVQVKRVLDLFKTSLESIIKTNEYLIEENEGLKGLLKSSSNLTPDTKLLTLNSEKDEKIKELKKEVEQLKQDKIFSAQTSFKILNDIYERLMNAQENVSEITGSPTVTYSVSAHREIQKTMALISDILQAKAN
jgi:hypothetical protein